jgi:hypothetical protein
MRARLKRLKKGQKKATLFKYFILLQAIALSNQPRWQKERFN